MAEDRGQTIYRWIMDRLAEGRAVYATNHLRCIKIAPKHRDCVRYHNGHCEVRAGKRWDSINYCQVTADN